jgi:hypothetical protein
MHKVQPKYLAHNSTCRPSRVRSISRMQRSSIESSSCSSIAFQQMHAWRKKGRHRVWCILMIADVIFRLPHIRVGGSRQCAARFRYY